jgi:hypothetical protein
LAITLQDEDGVVVVVVVVVDVDVDVDVDGVVVVVLADVEVVVLVVLGVAVVTAAVGSEVETDVPFLLFAVTTTRSVEPTSVLVARYVCSEPDAMSEQEAPLLIQRAHWKSYFAEGPLHFPVSACNVFPTTGTPEIVGPLVLSGALCPWAETVVFSALALAVNESSATRRTA